MDDPYEMPGVLSVPGDKPPATVFCLLPELPGVGRSRRRVAVPYTAAGAAPHPGVPGSADGSRGTAR